MDFKEPQLPRTNETDIRSISGLISATPDMPAGAPRNFSQQFRIVTGVLYFFDTIASAWYAAGNNVVSSAGQLIVNVAGTIQGVAALIWDGAKLAVTGDIELPTNHTLNSPTDGALSFGQSGPSHVNLIGAGPPGISTPGRSVGLQPGQGVDSGIDGDIFLYPNSANTSNSRTGGFLIIPTSAGTPSGTPHQTTFPSLVYDTTNDKLWSYNGGSWKAVTFT